METPATGRVRRADGRVCLVDRFSPPNDYMEGYSKWTWCGEYVEELVGDNIYIVASLEATVTCLGCMAGKPVYDGVDGFDGPQGPTGARVHTASRAPQGIKGVRASNGYDGGGGVGGGGIAHFPTTQRGK